MEAPAGKDIWLPFKKMKEKKDYSQDCDKNDENMNNDCYMDNAGFYVEAVGYPQMPLGPLENYAKVIGNIFDNPDLLNN